MCTLTVLSHTAHNPGSSAVWLGSKPAWGMTWKTKSNMWGLPETRPWAHTELSIVLLWKELTGVFPFRVPRLGAMRWTSVTAL